MTDPALAQLQHASSLHEIRGVIAGLFLHI